MRFNTLCERAASRPGSNLEIQGTDVAYSHLILIVIGLGLGSGL